MGGIRRKLLIAALLALAASPTLAAEPIRVGCSMAMTGGVAGIGKQVLIALEIWRDDLNAKGGLLGRPVELDCYDDQSNPANVPGIYTKLINVDKVELLIGPYATNMVAPVIPILMQANKMTVGILANAANSEFHYPKYFSMNATGQEPERSYSTGFFELAKAHPELKTVALIGADAEYGRNAIEGARKNAKDFGLKIVYDRAYPPTTADYSPILRAVQAANPDIVFVAAYPPDSQGVVRALGETGYTPKMFGGAMVGLGITTMKQQLGPLLDGIVNSELLLPSKSLNFQGLPELVAKYQERAKGQGVDPLGFTFPPFGYAAGQVLAEAVTATRSFDSDALADYIRSHTFRTVVGDIAYGKDGEWAKTRRFFAQFRDVLPNDVAQFRSTEHEQIVWPDEYKTADMIFPFAAARK